MKEKGIFSSAVNGSRRGQRWSAAPHRKHLLRRSKINLLQSSQKPASDGAGTPVLYEIHTRDWLLRFSSNRAIIRLDELPDWELDRLAGLGFNWIWLLGVWQTGPACARISRNQAEWQSSYRAALPDLKDEDIIGSTFAVSDYTVHRDFGGNEALANLRSRLEARSVHLMLDFVANHTALDHPWVTEHPDYYVGASEADLARQPGNYTRLDDGKASRIMAHGRDPYFPGWPDTLQLNYGNPNLRKAMLEQLQSVSRLCDGLRCDMAMLLLPEIFQRTWGIQSEPFWPGAIAATRRQVPGFLFLAEVYWGLEWELQQQGFDYTYDKTLYDRLLAMAAIPVRDHLRAATSFQQKSARFLENHDEPRIAATLPVAAHEAAAIIAFAVPGMKLLHDGQLEGYVRKPSIHLARRSIEPVNPELQRFYGRLLGILHSLPKLDWLLFETVPAWASNPTSSDFICFGWLRGDQLVYIIAVNYAAHDSQCYLRFPPDSVGPGPIVLRDLMGSDAYERKGDALMKNGLYLALPAWGYNLFAVSGS